MGNVTFIPPPIPKGNGAVGTTDSIPVQHSLQCLSGAAFSRAVWVCVQHSPVQGSAVLGDVGALALSPWAPFRVALSSGVNGMLSGRVSCVPCMVSDAGAGGGSEDGDGATTPHAGLSLASHYHQLHPSEAPRAVPITACLVPEHLLQPSWWKCILPSLKGLDHLSPSLSPLPYPTERIALPTPQAWRQQRNPRG